MSPLHTLFEIGSRLLARYHFVALGCVIAVTGAALGLLPRLTLNDDMRNVFRRTGAAESSMATARPHCLVVLETDVALSPSDLPVIYALHNQLQDLNGVRVVYSMLDARRPLRVGRYVLPLFVGPEMPEARAREALLAARRDTFINANFLSTDGRCALIDVELSEKLSRDEERRLVQQIRDVVKQIVHEDHMRTHIAGFPAIRAEISDAVYHDLLLFNILGGLASITISILLFRKLSVALIVMAGPYLGVLWTMGMLAAVGEPINIINGILIPLTLTIGLTDSVHLMFHMRRCCAAGQSPSEAAVSALRHVGPACVLTTATTAVGFGSLAVAQLDIIRRFGLCAAGGVLLTGVAVLIVVPLLARTRLGNAILPANRGSPASATGPRRPWQAYQSVMRLVLRHCRIAGIASLALTLALCAVAMQLRPNVRVADALPTGGDTLHSIRQVDTKLGGSLPLTVIVEWPDDTTPQPRELLHVIGQVQNLLTDRQGVNRPVSLVDVLNSLPGSGEDPAARFGELRYMNPHKLQRLIDRDQRQAYVLSRYQDVGTRAMQPVLQEMERGLAEIQREHPDFEISIAAFNLDALRGADVLIHDLLSSLWLAVAICAVVMGVTFRSVKIGIISLLPNLFPLAATASFMVFFGIPLQFTTASVFTICFGLAVDDTIHLLFSYHKHALEGHAPEARVMLALQQVSGAVVATTAVLSMGLAVVLVSEVEAVRLFGALLCLGLLWALAGDLLILPASLAAWPPSLDHAGTSIRGSNSGKFA